MNFKPTLWKIIISIIFGLLTIFSLMTKCIYTCEEYAIKSISEFVIGFALVYIIWSLIQKKR